MKTEIETIPTRTMKAKYDGQCSACRGRIFRGDDIEWSSQTGALHIVCPEKKTATTVTVEAPTNPEDLLPGVYELPDGVIYIVKPNREKTRLYAKRLVEITGDRLTETDQVVKIDFVYESGAVYRIKPEYKMPFERARELTIRYGRCIVCGIFLKAAKSVEQGIGPVCRKSFRMTSPKVSIETVAA